MKRVAMNVGEQVVDWLYSTQLQVDDEWSIRTPTGFTWWADENAQTIEIVGEETAPDGETGYLVSVRTEMLHGVELTDAALAALNDGPMGWAAMSGPVYDLDARTLNSCALALVSADIAPWMRILLSAAAVLQIGEARSLGPALALSVGARQAISGHPHNGIRPTPDQIAFTAGIFIEGGRAPCRWPEAEFRDAVDEYMMQPPSIGATSGGVGFTVEFPFGDGSSLCQVSGDQPHLLYGNGLLVLQRFPYDAGSQADGIKLALSLNTADLVQEMTGYGLGSYVYDDGMLSFTGFYPNELYHPGTLPNIYFSCANRAHATAVRLLNREWDADAFSLDAGGPGEGEGAMRHRFAIFPAGSVDTIERADDLADAMSRGGVGEPLSPVRELIDELSETAASFHVTSPLDGPGVVIATHRPEDGLLRLLLLATKARGLALFDMELHRLHDPLGCVEVEVSLPGNLVLPYVTPLLLSNLVLLPTWPVPAEPYFIVMRGDDDYVQTYRDEDGTYQLEYRDGGPDAHFACRTRNSGLVADVMWAWATREPRWRTAVAWERLQFDDLQ
jgi:hypothetical protein